MSKKNKSSVLSGQLSPVFVFSNSIALVLIAAVLSVALFSYQPTDPAWSHNNGGEVQNSLGTIGAWYSDLSFSILGKLSYLLPLALLAFAVQIWLGKGIDKEVLSWRLFMLLTAILSGCVLWTKHDPAAINEVAITGGGALGAWLTIGLEKSIRSIPIIMAFSTVIFLISMTLLLNLPWLKIAEWLGKGLSMLLGGLLGGLWGGMKVSRNQSKAAKPPQDVNNDALQDKIQQLNQQVEQQKHTDKPKFTIDRYHEDEWDNERQDNAYPPHFAANSKTAEAAQPSAVQPPTAVTEPMTEAEPTEAAIEQAIPLSTLSAANPAKAEPSFFDFGEIRPQREPNVELAAKPITAEPVTTQAVTAQPVTANTDEALAETADDSQASAFSQPRHQTPDTLNTQEQATSSPAFSVTDDIAVTAANTVADNVTEPTVDTDTATQATIEPSEALIKAIQGSSAAETVAANLNTPPETAQPAIEPVQTEQAAQAPVQQPVEPQQPIQQPIQQPVQQPAPQPEIPVAATAATTAKSIPAQVSKVSIGKAYDSREEGQIAQPVKRHTLPSIDLLDTPPPQENAYTEDVLAEMAGVLERTLKQFNVEATVMHVSPGPVITRFEIDLAPGIQAKKITSLSVDLARALAVSGVRVEEVIPGNSYVGLEVPNKQRQVVYFKDVVRSKAFQSSQSPLTVSLGSDTSGKPITADLMKMPHALVAGTTGSGKSVCINVMLLSMLYKATPKDLRLILVDPKMLEMSMYEDIPHLLTPVITDMNEAENALTWAVGEMERRYQLMAALKVRKIDAFNQTVEDAIARGEPIKDPLWNPDESVGYTHHPSLERLPFIVIVIDELADMMMVVGKQVEQLIARLTQKARAAGIHVVLATQRPSTDVLTGLIKANVPTRIAFQVSSGTDSRVIIDGVGAEKLLGHGDMLYVPPGAGHPQRLHGAFVDDAETDRVTTFLRSTGEPDYIDGITGKQDPETLGAFGAAEAAEAKEDADPLYGEAVQIVLETGKASISSVQRQLRIGYNRAARMIEDMQDQGIVSEPVNGIRKVLGAPKPKE